MVGMLACSAPPAPTASSTATSPLIEPTSTETASAAAQPSTQPSAQEAAEPTPPRIAAKDALALLFLRKAFLKWLFEFE